MDRFSMAIGSGWFRTDIEEWFDWFCVRLLLQPKIIENAVINIIITIKNNIIQEDRRQIGNVLMTTVTTTTSD